MKLPTLVWLALLRLSWFLAAAMGLRAVVALLMVFGAFAQPGDGAGARLGAGLTLLVSAGLCVAFVKLSRFVVSTRTPLEDLTGLGQLRLTYVERRLDLRATSTPETGPYATTSDDELADVLTRLDAARFPEREAQALDAIKRRVEQAYLPDGRLLPAALRGLAPLPAPGANCCAVHPSAAAVVTCRRCGSFVCAACSQSDHVHCERCLDVLVPRPVVGGSSAHEQTPPG